MINGVSRKVVEINNPESIYFEKAIFYLRPHMSDIPEKLLSKEAENYMSEISASPETDNSKFRTSFSFVCIILSVLVLISGIIYSILTWRKKGELCSPQSVE